MKKNFKCIVAYDGTNYFGWQKQNDCLTVQGVIEYCLEKIFNEKVNTMGASRTDAGVHAFGQVFNFKVDTQINEEGMKKILNSLLPEDIVIKKVAIEDDKFYPRANVKKKFYRYLIYNAAFLPPVLRNYVWHIKEKIDINKFFEIIDLFKGIKDFYSFSSSGSEAKETRKEILNLKIKKQNKFIIFDFIGKSFLYNMIRKIVGVFVEYSLNKITQKEIEMMFEKHDRSILKTIAPAGGLYLIKIIYEKRK